MTNLTAMLLSAMRVPATTTTETTTPAPVVVTTPTTTPAISAPSPATLETKITEEIIIENNIELNKKRRDLAKSSNIITSAESQADAVLLMNRNYFAMMTINPANGKPYADYSAIPDATKPLIDTMVLEMVNKTTGIAYEDIEAYRDKMVEDNIKTSIETNADYKNLLRAMKIAAEMD